MPEKILIIDDEQDIADLLEVYLKNENYVVYKFYCATDAMSCPLAALWQKFPAEKQGNPQIGLSFFHRLRNHRFQRYLDQKRL